MYKKIKILLLLSFLVAGCKNANVTENKKFMPIIPEQRLSTPESDIVNRGNRTGKIAENFNLKNPEETGENIPLNSAIGDILKNSNMSFYAVDISTGKMIADYRGEKVATPASVMKIVTAATALEVLGKDTTLETELLMDGKIDNNGSLNGNIYIRGGGDPTLGSENFKGNREKFLDEWVMEIKKKGIKNIKGNILVIDDLFGYDGVSGKWLLEDLASGYGQGVYGISVFDNICTIYMNSDSKSGKVVKTVPAVKNLTFVNNLKISEKGRTDVAVRGLPFDTRRVLTGEIPANRKNIMVRSDIPDPGKFLGEYFRDKLVKSGISVKGVVKTARTERIIPKNTKTICVTQSKTVGEMINVLLVKSDNHYAEHLYQLIKLKGIDIGEFWKEKGIDTSALAMYDGSGLSRADYISAQVLTDILLYMDENYPEYEEMLPKAGEEGTVAGFLNGNFDGVARIKSGSMGGVQSYAGYMEKDGRKIAFTIMINQWHGSRKQVKKEIENLLINLF